MLIDVHSHIHDKAFDEDRDTILAQMKEEGMMTITVGTDVEESKKAVACAEKYDNVWATVGMHPVDNREEIFDVELYRELLMHEKVVALGECGLDYFRLDEFEGNKDQEVDRQQRLFQEQISLSVETGKPLMLHGRPSKGTMDAYEDMIHMLMRAQDEFGIDAVKGNVHFFVGNIVIAQAFLKLGFTMSFSGIITFAKEYEEVIQSIPIEMLHAETDSPYAAPMPNRGKRNQPSYVQHTVAKIAEIKGLPLEEVKEQLVKNAHRVFGLTS